MSEAVPVVGRGFCYEDLKVGFRFRTHRRTVAESDLAGFVNLTWLTEELFTVADDAGRAIKGRPVPAAFVYACAEGLLLPTMQDTGLAFLNATLDVKAPTVVGDTIHVEAEVTEARLTSKGDRGLVRFANQVVNQRGETVLTYDPLRMLRRRQGQTAVS
jgi:acyl dehydratase